MNYTYRLLFPAMLLLLSTIAFGGTLSTAHAAVECTNFYTQSKAVPTGYGAAYNLFTTAKELLVQTSSCTDTNATVTVGKSNTGMYVYKEGYYWNGSWQKFSLTSSNPLQANTWYVGDAQASIPLQTGNSERYYVGYVCQQVNAAWKCGCNDSTCAAPVWQLQKVVKTQTGQNNPVCGNNVCEQGETTQTCPADCRTSGGESNSEAIYPAGNKFLLGLYAINNDFSNAAAAGWNVCHTYSAPPTTPSYINTCKSAGMMAMGRLSATKSGSNSVAKPESTIAAEIASMGGTNAVALWDLPEEQRYWIPSEMAIVTQYSEWTRKHDPKKLPNYMYIPGHYGAAGVAKYVKYLDIVPASAYAGYMGQPNTYVRWSIERTFQGIADAGYRIGKDYKNGEKTVMAILEIFPAGTSRMSPTQSRHDFWLSIASDVKGILVYAYHYRNSDANLGACMAALSDAATKFKSAQLDRVMIEGTTNSSVGFTITSGPQRTPTFTPLGGTATSYPSLKVLAKTWNGSTYIVAVNSNPLPVTANITGLSSGSATVLFENRNVPVQSGTITDTFTGLGFHVYKL